MNSGRGWLLGLLLTVPCVSLAVDCTPASITLSSQAEVDAFQANHGPGCDRIVSGLTVSGASITDLTPLSGLTSAAWGSRVAINNTSVEDLEGLDNLASAHWLELIGNTALTDLTALSGLDVPGPFFINGNTALTNLDGLQGLTALYSGALIIENNTLLADLSGLANLSSISGSLVIGNNDSLSNLDDLSGLVVVSSNINISNNDLLTDIGGLGGLVGFSAALYIRDNAQLASLGNLSNLSELGGLVIWSNPALAHLDGLASLTTLGNKTALSIRYNNTLSSIAGLSNVVSADDDVELTDNPQLGECSALQTLLDDVDDGDAGPGPGGAGVPDVAGDVTLGGNLSGCNSIEEIIGIVPAPPFALVPDFGGLDNHSGAFSLENPDQSCSWIPGETVEIWWDAPEILLATTEVDPQGCFQVLFKLDTEKITGSTPGAHFVEARGSVTGAAMAAFEQVAPQLVLAPPMGAPGREVNVTGCEWEGASSVNVTWLDDGTLLGSLTVDGFGCVDSTIKLPKVKGGIFPLIGEADNALATGTAFEVIPPDVGLLPPEGPPGARIGVYGCNWFPDEIVEFTFQADGIVFSLVDTGPGGCLTNKLGGDPFIEIPATATLGEKILNASGQSSNLQVNQPFTVREPTLSFTPDSGLIGDPIIVSGCGWAENQTVKVTWGHNDHNNQPIEWIASVDAHTGCFGQDGELVIDIPADSNTGAIGITAAGNVSGLARATLTVNHVGTFYAPDPNGYAGYAITLQFENAIPNEVITVQTSGNTTTQQSVLATGAEFTFDYTLPSYYPANVQTSLAAFGTKGFSGVTSINILDNAEIAVDNPGGVRSGRALKVEGTNWSSDEGVQFRLVQGEVETYLYPAAKIAAGKIDFVHYIDIPSTVAAGDYLLKAEGNKGRDATLPISIDIGLPSVFALGAQFAHTPPDLDGSLKINEWDYDQKAPLPSGFITVRSDETRLYVLLDLLGDSGEDSLGTDGFWLSFDVQEDQSVTPGWDLNFRLDGTGDLVLDEYTGPNSFSPRNSAFLRSAYAAGFGCFMADGTLELLSPTPPTFQCNDHRVYEIAIELAAIQAQPGDTIRMGLRSYSGTPSFTDDVPANFVNDFSNLVSITLADSQFSGPPPNGQINGIGQGGFAIEVTQAIQDAGNDLPLVADKATSVRVYPDVAAEATVRTYLFGERAGQDLPGSPLVTLSTVPVNIDREQFEQTANFLLPDSWIGPGLLNLTAIIESLDGGHTTAFGEQVNFISRKVPEIWIFPFNVGDNANPVLPETADMVEQQQVLKRLLPVPDVTFPRRQWTDVSHTLSIANCPPLTGIGNNDGFLDPGETLSCSNSHTVTQADIDRETYSISAVAAADGGALITGRVGMSFDGPEPPAELQSAAYPRAQAKPPTRPFATAQAADDPGTPSLGISIAADVADFDKVGDVINFTYEVTNPGSAPAPGPVTVADSESAVDFEDMKAALNTRWTAEVQARAMSGNPAPMPDAFYGFKIFSDQSTIGTSDPTWISNGRGYVVVGQADGRDVNTTTMVHELNHNLDRSTAGTWGRHVSDPEDKDNSDWGCGAGGSDPSWPYDGDSEIQEVGFNTALPWNPSSGELTVIPAARDDYQSYCWVDSLPIQWISPYRWEQTFARMGLPQAALNADSGPALDVLYISGAVFTSGPGQIASVLRMPGTVETAAVPGAWAIELRDLADDVLYSMSFDLSFVDSEGVALESAPFYFSLPDQAGLTRVVLIHNGVELDSIGLSDHAPTVQVTSPGSGEIWDGEATIQWVAEDLDGDSLRFSLFYSPDGGLNWHPVASGLSSNEYTLNTRRLPGGTDGAIMVAASDGLHTGFALSSGSFEVREPDPVVVIDSPADGLVLRPSDRLDLAGSASLPSGSADSLLLTWFVDDQLIAMDAQTSVYLDQGVHEITLLANGDQGNFGTARVTVFVEQNGAPHKPIQPSPADGAVLVPRDVALGWLAGDIEADPVLYDVYLAAGNAQSETLVCDGLAVSSCTPPALLEADTVYFWRVVARGSEGEVVESKVWQFDTGLSGNADVIHKDGFE